MDVLVTGANGFIGSHVVRALLAEGHGVRAMVRRTSDRSLLSGLAPEYVIADAEDPASLPAAVRGVDAIFHVAASLGAPDQAGFDSVNVHGTRALALSALEHAPGLRRFLLVSSLAAAGPSRPGRPRTEDDEPAPVSMYGRSKLQGERALGALEGRVPVTIARPPAVYGPGGATMVPLFRAAGRGVVADVMGPAPALSLIDVRDLARGLVLAGTSERGAGEAFFLVGPRDATPLGLQQAIARAMGARALRVPVPAALLRLAGHAADGWKRASGQRFPFGRDKVAEVLAPGWAASGEKARRLLGFEATIDFEDGLRDAASDYRARGWL